jgi:hypothetical protein
MQLIYFVTYYGVNQGRNTTGNYQLTAEEPVTGIAQIQAFERRIEELEKLERVVITHWQRFEEPKAKLYRAKLKTREEMLRDIPRDQLGWWYDVCPGETLTLRDATDADIARCSLREGTSRDPADYMCENIERGALILRAAIAYLIEIPA